MSSSDDSTPPVEKRFRDLLEAAGEDAMERSRTEKLSLDKAHETLDTLLEEAGGVEFVTAHSQSVPEIMTTQDAMESLFIESGQHNMANPDVLVGLDESQGIPDMGQVIENGHPVIAGAEKPDSHTEPVKRLDDGVDFWRELENIEPEPDN